ncbi:MAG: DNA polymerase III subunit delta [Streptococcaceae bacterium]|jgi:DNA polymerase-3 subunit delta|nr:DNA polymerase III subunit delta [Streptococcaceae bacterium]
MIFDDLEKIVSQGLPPILAIFGEEIEMVVELRDELLSAVTFDRNNLNQAHYDLTASVSADEVLDELESLPFFGDSQFVLLENLTNLTGAKKKAFDEKQLGRFEAYLANPLETTQLVIVVRGKLDSRLKLTKLLKKTAVCLEAKAVRPQELAAYFPKSGLSRSVLARVIEKSGGSYATAKANIALLKTYASGRDITLSDVEKVVPKSLSDQVFDLSDFVIAGKTAQARELVGDLLLQGEEILRILGFLTTSFRTYLQVKLMADGGMSEAQMTSSLKIHPYRVKLAAQTVRRLTTDRLKKALSALIELDYQIKTSVADKNFLFDLLLIKLSTEL